MSCEINDRIKDNILDKIAEMSLEDKKLYLINYVKNVLKDYDGDDIDEAVAEVMWEEHNDWYYNSFFNLLYCFFCVSLLYKKFIHERR